MNMEHRPLSTEQYDWMRNVKSVDEDARCREFLRPLDTGSTSVFLLPMFISAQPWTPRPHYFGVHAQNFSIRDAGTRLKDSLDAIGVIVRDVILYRKLKTVEAKPESAKIFRSKQEN
jgi:hypothetical protein